MKKKFTLVATVFIIFVFLYISACAIDMCGTPKEKFYNLSVVQNSAPLTLVSARVGTFVFDAEIQNNSDVPVTLVVTELICEGVNAGAPVFGQMYDWREERFFPVEIPIGESVVTRIENTFGIGKDSNCTLEIKSWSRYNEK